MVGTSGFPGWWWEETGRCQETGCGLGQHPGSQVSSFLANLPLRREEKAVL